MLRFILFLLFWGASIAYSQDVRLLQCWEKAEQNYPRARDREDYERIANLRVKNYRAVYLPKVDVNAQVTYQSDVTHLNASKIPIPNFNIGSPAKDQYKLTADISQLIWDGGAAKASEKLEMASLYADKQQVEVDLYNLKGRVAQLFYSVALKREQIKLQRALKADLDQKMKRTISGVRNGATLKANELLLRSEILKLTQEIDGAENEINGLIDALSILVGEPISRIAEFVWVDIAMAEISRPEYMLFQKQKDRIEMLNETYTSKRMPKIAAFGQVGYGKPGLNMFSTSFDPFYIVGLKASWNIFDWNSTKRDRQSLRLQQSMVDTRQSMFEISQKMELAQESSTVAKYESLLKTDEELITARQEVAKAYSVMYDNGAIDAADYVGRQTELKQAELNREMHRVMLSFSKVNINIIKGK